MTKIIGLTGGIGSGKTTIAKLFEAEGIPIYISDEEAKKIMSLPETVKAIETVFGPEVILNQQIDRKKLAAIVFNDETQLKVLNEIVHPLVKKHFEDWVQAKQNFPFIIKEAAILFESGSDQFCDKIITVTASQETRIKRVMQRDHVSEQEVLERMKNQWSDEERIAKSDFVIENENFESAKVKFYEILKILKNL
ncbi:dephospho-CoA kinase [Flavobacterium luminosum]|uniref:Dephospho-CoA kinase n=1 Tax=Flavobacterium luminosum TaxID=2949086 RepID=A0ABT0TMC8_9FLAO|nr:dephospho-CoA kinase [Flavobacterium sp. HXWNR70]MCL9808540.1 dephospho-CoA kinase [Flavobacterium sp. HXWNR70]